MFYDKFVELCKAKGMSPAAVAKDIGLSNSSTTTWKRGSIPKGDTLQKLADYFDVSVDYLLGVYTPMEGVTVSGDPDGVAAIRDLFEKATKARRGQKTYGGLTYEELCALHDLNTHNRLEAAYAKLDLVGRERVADYAEKLTKDPKRLVDQKYPYRYPPQGAPELTPSTQEGKDIAPPPDAPKTPPESK